MTEPVRFGLLFDGRPAAGVPPRSIASAAVQNATAAGSRQQAAARFVEYWPGAGIWERMGAAKQDALALRMPKVSAEFEAVFADPVSPSDYNRLTMPVYLLGGDQSPASVKQVLERLAMLLACTERATLTGLGPMGPVQAPERIARLLPAALRGSKRSLARRRGRSVPSQS